MKRYDLIGVAFEALKDSSFEEFSELNIKWWNIAPSLQVPVVRMDDTGKRIISPLQWGFIPTWARELPKTRPINAKGETVATNGMFRSAFKSRRCLIPADGFYEWHGPKPPKQPYFIHLKTDGLFAFAGLWERWKPQHDAAPIDSFTIITTQPNPLMATIHNRMPVIIPPQDYARWLDTSMPIDDAANLLKPYPADEMDAYPISSVVNSPKNDGPELIQPALNKPDQGTLF